MLKLISLNIELNKHYERNIPFFQKEQADVICLQEIFEKDLEFLRQETGMPYSLFAPMSLIPYSPKENPIEHPYRIADAIAAGKEDAESYEIEPVGIAIFSRLPFKTEDTFYYWEPKNGIGIHDTNNRENSEGRVLLTIAVEKDGTPYTVGTTHFTWSAQGLPDQAQRLHSSTLLEKLTSTKDIVCCGDFNAPRGGEIFTLFTEKFKNHVPDDCDTTLDKKYHRNGDLHLVVDALLTSPEYSANNVRIVDGVSDHMAIVADIIRV